MSEDGIEKITIRIDGKVIELSLEQARKLHGELDKLFGAKALVSWQYVYPPTYPTYPRYTWSNETTYANGNLTLTV